MSVATIQLGDLIHPVWSGAAIFLRISALVSVAPIIGERVVPLRVRLAIAIVMTLAIAHVGFSADLPSGPVDLAVFAAAEVLTGLAIGMSLRVFVMVLHLAGSIAAQTTSLAQLMGTPGVDPMPAMSQILVVAALAMAAGLGLHHDMLRLLALSFEAIPPGSFPDPRLLLAMSVSNLSKATTLAFSCAAPFVIASLVYNIALGVINRAMPQLMVAFVGAPAITLASVGLLALTAGGMLVAWWARLPDFILLPVAP